MINYYQPFLIPFLHTKPYHLPSDLKQYYYFSWEDALWDVLIQKDIPRGAVILIPDFYCIDVVVNIQNHGYTVVFYSLDDHLQIDPTSFAQVVKKEKPSVIIVFHPAGITSRLFTDTSWTREADNAIIIEDCVHRLTDPDDIRLIASNHVVMDSLRKDSPLPGSFLYGSREFLSYQPKIESLWSFYVLNSLVYFIVFRVTLMISAILDMPTVTKYAHEVILKRHDDIIGDSLRPHSGLPFIPLLHRFIDFKKVKRIKEKQATLYDEQISTLLKDKKLESDFYKVNINTADYQHLHVFPLGMKGIVSKERIDMLHKHGVIIWNKFPDCPWSQTRSMLFLPLGFHISEKNIKKTLNVIVSTSLS